jgi:hypothetical protein
MIRKISLPVFMFIAAAAPSQAQPVLSLPLDKSFVEKTNPALLWEKMDDANVYVVSVFADRKGVRRVAKFTVRGNSCQITEGNLEQGKRYWWNVAPSRGGILDEPSAMWSFTVLQEEAPERESLDDYQPQLFKTAPGGKTESPNDVAEDAPAVDAPEDLPEEPARSSRAAHRSSRYAAQKAGRTAARPVRAARAAQSARFEIGAGPAYSVPQGDAGDAYKSAAGLNSHFDYIVNESAAVGFETAFFTYAAKYDLPHGSGRGPDAATAYYGLRGKFGKPMDFGSHRGKFYGVFGMASYSVAALEPDAAGAVTDMAKFGLSFGGGCDVEIAPQWTAELEVRYHLVNDFSTVSPILKVAYSF